MQPGETVPPADVRSERGEGEMNTKQAAVPQRSNQEGQRVEGRQIR